MNGTLGDEVLGTHQEVYATITEHNFHVCRATTLQLCIHSVENDFKKEQDVSKMVG